MRQLFFTPPLVDPHIVVAKAFTPAVPGARYHVWTDGTQAAGVVEMDGDCDAERVIDLLEAQGIQWLPNHLHNPSTGETMNKFHAQSGFPHLKPKRF